MTLNVKLAFLTISCAPCCFSTDSGQFWFENAFLFAGNLTVMKLL